MSTSYSVTFSIKLICWSSATPPKINLAFLRDVCGWRSDWTAKDITRHQQACFFKASGGRKLRGWQMRCPSPSSVFPSWKTRRRLGLNSGCMAMQSLSIGWLASIGLWLFWGQDQKHSREFLRHNDRAAVTHRSKWGGGLEIDLPNLPLTIKLMQDQ